MTHEQILVDARSDARRARERERDLRRELLSPERVRELSRLAPWRPIVAAAFNWAIIAAAWIVAARWPYWWIVLAAVPLIGNRYYHLFILGHDGFHRRLLGSQRANDLFNDVVLIGPVGAITRLNNRNHLSHHANLATEEDPDRHKHACFAHATRNAVLGFVSGATSLGRALRNVFGPARRAGAGATASGYGMRDLFILAGWQIGLIGGLTYLFGWWGYPVMWLAPVYAFVFMADNFRSFAEHSQPEVDEKADEHRLITFTGSWLERTLVAPMNMNYHAVHHLWPSIPYYNLPEADREVTIRPAAAAIERRSSYFVYLRRYLGLLPLTDCERAAKA